jgi:hypothetical protein
VKIYNKYVLTVAISLLLTTVLLIALGQNSLDIYFTVYIIEALIITEAYVYLNSKARRELSFVAGILFACFVIAVSLQVYKLMI